MHVRPLRRVIGAVLTRQRRCPLQNAMSTWRARAAAFDAMDTAHSLAVEVEELSTRHGRRTAAVLMPVKLSAASCMPK